MIKKLIHIAFALSLIVVAIIISMTADGPPNGLI